MEFKLNINCDTAAFAKDPFRETALILRAVADRIYETAETDETIRDTDGNAVGSFVLEGYKPKVSMGKKKPASTGKKKPASTVKKKKRGQKKYRKSQKPTRKKSQKPPRKRMSPQEISQLEKKWRGVKSPKPLDFYTGGVRGVVSGGLPELGKRR